MNPKLVVQSLEGFKAQILWAFFFAGKGMTVKELVTWTGKQRNAHGVALNALCGAQLLERRKMANGEDWWCLGHDVIPLLQDMVKQLGAGIYLQGEMKLLEDPQMSEKQTSGLEPVVEGVARSAEELEALNVAFRDCRILTGKTTVKLLACEWVNAEYVRAWVDFEKGEAHQPEWAIARAIKKMLAHYPQPLRRANGHMENCQCADCALDSFTRKKYLEGLPDYGDEDEEDTLEVGDGNAVS